MKQKYTHTHTQTHSFNGPFSVTTWVDFTEARDSEWQWHQLGHMQVCISLQTDNDASTSPVSFLQAGCPSCHPYQQRQSTEGKNTLNSNSSTRKLLSAALQKERETILDYILVVRPSVLHVEL